MDNRKPLPTTVTAVESYLKARADFRGIDERGQVHYLLGMCEALLAEANSEIKRLKRQHAQFVDDAVRALDGGE